MVLPVIVLARASPHLCRACRSEREFYLLNSFPVILSPLCPDKRTEKMDGVQSSVASKILTANSLRSAESRVPPTGMYVRATYTEREPLLPLLPVS